ncbi:MAG TPA: hypothetical protein VK988_06135 [Acidimicrobiales bacterium]|nr:hypothetical protein [Acidimicrobiales bacterium]
MQQRSIGRGRKAALFGFTTTAIVLALASTAFACVAFMGQMTVDGDDGDTTVVGTGNSHGYCSTGKPTTAAAGHLTDNLSLSVSPGDCFDTSPLAAGAGHKLPAGLYEVRYNNEKAYTFDGTSWKMANSLGCFLPTNADTTSTIGTFDVDANGDGSWTGDVDPIMPLGLANYYPPAGAAANLCVGSVSPLSASGTTGGRPGMLAPYRLLAI